MTQMTDKQKQEDDLCPGTTRSWSTVVDCG
jgi:hypothetical protein